MDPSTVYDLGSCDPRWSSTASPAHVTGVMKEMLPANAINPEPSFRWVVP